MHRFSKREVFIVVAAVLAVLYGLTDYWSRKGDDPELMEGRLRTEGFIDFMTRLNTRLAGTGLRASERYVVGSVLKPWKNEGRFWKPPDPAIKDDEKKALNIPVSEYSGYMKMGEKSIAIIDGMPYREGDFLPGNIFVVKRITPELISIEWDGKTSYTIPINQAENDHQIQISE